MASRKEKFADRVVLVTGATGEIGREIALAFSYREADVAVVAQDRSGIGKLESEIRAEGGIAAGIVLDPAVPGDVTRLVEETTRRFGRIDILVNTAGVVCGSRSIEEITPEEWEEVTVRPLRTVFLCSRAFSAVMRRQGRGTIVNVAIHAGARTSHFGGPHNAAAKAGVIGFTRQVSKELSRHRIHVRAVGLSLVHGTPGNGALWDYYRESELDRFANDVPSGRLVSGRDAAYAVL